jgi:beta-carotene hydroxylase
MTTTTLKRTAEVPGGGDEVDVHATTAKKPAIPKSYYEKTLIGAVGLICFMLAMAASSTAAAYFVWMKSDWVLPLKLAVSVPLYFFAGQSVHLMGWIGHDGFHLTFHKNKYVSMVLAILFSAMTLVFMGCGMAIDHWSHHRFANTDKDPDVPLLAHFQSFWSRMLKQRNRANLHYFKRCFGLALGRPLPAELQHVRLPLSLSQFRVLAILNLVCAVGWLSVYVYLNELFPGFLLIGVLIPLVVGGWLSGLRSFTEHANTGVGDLRNTRSRTHWFLTFIEYGGNYHLEHHLYPSVPQWRLPSLHRWLKAQGFYDKLPDPSIIDPSLAVYRYAQGKYPYGRTVETPSPRSR